MDFLKALILSYLVLAAVSCDRTEGKAIEIPSVYEFSRDGNSTVNFTGQTTRLQMSEELIALLENLEGTEVLATEMFTNEMSDGSDANPFANADLNESSKSIFSKVAASTDLFNANTVESSTIKSKFQSFITNQYNEVIPAQGELAEEAKAGQIADGTKARYVNSKGMENNQLFAKSLIGALVLDQILNNYLSPTVLDAASNIADNDNGVTLDGKSYTSMEHKWDEAYGYLFGQATNKADPLMNLGQGSFLNKYLSRVENDADFEGIASDIYDAFKHGRAAIVAGDYQVRDEQAEILKIKLSEIIAIRAVHYLQAGKRDKENGEIGSAFHALSEGYGFIYSLRFSRDARSSNSIFSQSEVQEFITTLEKDNGFWSLTTEEMDTMSDEIAAKFDFTVAQAAE